MYFILKIEHRPAQLGVPVD